MHNRLYKFLEKFELLYPLQFGFRGKHSTTSYRVNQTFQ